MRFRHPVSLIIAALLGVVVLCIGIVRAPLPRAGFAMPENAKMAPKILDPAPVEGAVVPGESRPAGLQKPAPPLAVKAPSRLQVEAVNAADAYVSMLAGAKLERTERRMFQAQTWETDLGKSLELKAGERLERRSGIYHLPGAPYPLVRVDRVYLLGGSRTAVAARLQAVAPPIPREAGATVTTDPSRRAAAGEAAVPGRQEAAPDPSTAPEPSPVGPLDAGGGELVWSNAMVADHLMVQVEPGVSVERLAGALPPLARLLKRVTDGGLYLVEVPAEGERTIERAVLALNQLKGVVKFAEPDFVMTSADVSANDPLFTANAADLTKQWHLAKIMAPRAWGVLTGPPFPPGASQYQQRLDQTVVAIVDTGFDYTHPDLAPAMWINPGESGGGKETNGLDDDGDGKVDDWRGYDFIDGDNNPMDDVGHGTHVAGIVGAVGNNATGGAGVCWNVKLLNLRIIKKQGLGTIGYYSGAVAAMDYIRTLNQLGRKVAVANHSWGGNGYSLAMLNAINNPIAAADSLPTGVTGTWARDVNTFTVSGNAAETAKIKVGMTLTASGLPANSVVTIINGNSLTFSNYTATVRTSASLTFSNPIRPKPYGIVHVAAAGNSRYNSDRIPTYPACLPSGFMVSVGASDANGNVASFTVTAGSNYGRLNVDLFAPGSGIWSTYWKSASNNQPPPGFVPVPGSSTQGYAPLNGTSMAAPQAAAALALLRMWQPSLTEYQARQILIDQTDPVAALHDKCISGGHLNVAKMVDKVYQPRLVGSGGSTGGNATLASALGGGQSAVSSLASGGTMTLAIQGGTVMAWGSNSLGQLGTNSVADSAVPIQVPGLDNVLAVAAGRYTGYALKADGTVWAWGLSDGYSLGGAVVGIDKAPAKIPTLSDIVWISSQTEHHLAVRADGTVWAWGKNDYGQLGDGTTTPRSVPVQVVGLAGIVMADAGYQHSIALKSDGTVSCWGRRGVASDRNALGDGNVTGQSNSPVLVQGLTNVVYVNAGNLASIAVKDDGTAWQWGDGFGTPNSNVPIQRTDLANVVLASLSIDSGLALDNEGRVFGWGNGLLGNLGNGSYSYLTTGVEVMNFSGEPVVALAAGERVSYIMAVDGGAYAFGSNGDGSQGNGRLGIGTESTKYLPVRINRLDDIGHVTYGNSSFGSVAYAIDNSGSIFQWGKTSSGVLDDVPVGTQFMAGANRIKFGTRTQFCIFSKADGTLWAWGNNSDGQLGRGFKSFSSLDIPAEIAVGGPVVDFAGGAGFLAVSGESFYGHGHAAAVLASGVLKAWGNNSYGQLGDGTTTDRSSPTTVTGIPSAFRVATGVAHTVASMSDGSVWAWGKNHRGQLGDGGTVDRLSPKKIATLSNVVAVAAVAHSSFALKQDGTVWAWGQNDSTSGLGFSGSTNVLTPTQVLGLPIITAISAGRYSVAALAADGSVWAWGLLRNVGRGKNPTVQASLPAQVFGLSNVVEVVADLCSYARKSDGSVWAWGGDGQETLGDGENRSNFPIAILGFGGASTTLSTLGTGDTADSWYFQNFSVPELFNDGLVADLADPDRDGISNLLEYALSLNPRQFGQQGLPTSRVDLIGTSAQSESAGQIELFAVPTRDFADGKHYHALTVTRNGIRQDIDYIVEVSADLVNWQSGDPFTITVLDTAETLKVYDATAMEDAPKRFMRLKIQRK